MYRNKKGMIFTRKNYQCMLLGLFFLIVGYVLLSGGGSDDPKVFNPDVFNARRLVWAPIFLVLGYTLQVVAILIRAKSKETS